jgi:PII-like signaling protein
MKELKHQQVCMRIFIGEKDYKGLQTLCSTIMDMLKRENGRGSCFPQIRRSWGQEVFSFGPSSDIKPGFAVDC